MPTKKTANDMPAEIVLLYPKTGWDVGGHTVAPPHAVLAVAAPLHAAGYKVKIIDMRRENDWRETLRQSIGSNTICIGISAMTGTQLHFALLMAQESRNLSDGRVPLVWGGAHPSILPGQTAQHELVDVVVVGEGELTFMELVQAFEHKSPLSGIKGLAYQDGSQTIVTEPRPLMDVDGLLPVPWDLIPVEDYICEDNHFLKSSPRTLDIGQTSRGCPHRCGFCCSCSVRNRKWRAMSLDKAVERISEPVSKFNLTGVWIRDDEFYVNNSRAFDICEEIRARHNISWYASGSRIDDFNSFSGDQVELVKASGCKVTKFGAESGSDRILDLISKGFHAHDILKANEKCKKHGIIPAYAFITGFPTETFEDIDKTISLAFRLKDDYPQAQLEAFLTYTAFPGTPMWPLALSEGLVPPDRMEGWVDWIMDEYDLSGERIPWLNRKQRRWIGNIMYLSLLGNAIGNLGGGVQHPLLGPVFNLLLKSLRPYYGFRLRNKFYKKVPELLIASYLRKKLFYQSERIYR
jgi:anaerobic magnesium-protoporphyrin IX monomethyl ester cyclase